MLEDGMVMDNDYSTEGVEVEFELDSKNYIRIGQKNYSTDKRGVFIFISPTKSKLKVTLNERQTVELKKFINKNYNSLNYFEKKNVKNSGIFTAEEIKLIESGVDLQYSELSETVAATAKDEEETVVAEETIEDAEQDNIEEIEDIRMIEGKIELSGNSIKKEVATIRELKLPELEAIQKYEKGLSKTILASKAKMVRAGLGVGLFGTTRGIHKVADWLSERKQIQNYQGKEVKDLSKLQKVGTISAISSSAAFVLAGLTAATSAVLGAALISAAVPYIAGVGVGYGAISVGAFLGHAMSKGIANVGEKMQNNHDLLGESLKNFRDARASKKDAKDKLQNIPEDYKKELKTKRKLAKLEKNAHMLVGEKAFHEKVLLPKDKKKFAEIKFERVLKNTEFRGVGELAEFLGVDVARLVEMGVRKVKNLIKQKQHAVLMSQ